MVSVSGRGGVHLQWELCLFQYDGRRFFGNTSANNSQKAVIEIEGKGKIVPVLKYSLCLEDFSLV
jgi:hypothetical protein